MKKLTKEQIEKIDRTYHLLKTCNTRTKMARMGFRTLSQVDDAINTLYDIYIDGIGGTLNFNVACFFKKQGFRIIDTWIGWEIRA